MEGQQANNPIDIGNYHGKPAAADQASLLAQMASVAVENAKLYQEARQAQLALRENEQRLRAIIDNTPQCIKLIAADGTLLEMNRAGLAMVEADSAEAVVGQSIYALIAPEHLDQFRAFNEAVCAGQGGKLEFEIIGLRGSRRRVETIAVPLRTPDGAMGHLAITQDITERRRLEGQYVQAQKMEAIGRLAGGVAHDFNNLLTVINGYSSILLGTLHEHDKAREYIEQIAHAGERAAGLTHQLLAYSRKQMQQLKVLDLSELLSHTEKMLRRLIGEDVEMFTTLADDLRPIKADPSQMEQVIMNLCVNARDAMRTGGKLTIETQNVLFDESHRIERFEIPAGPYVLLTVTDTGCGMDPETRAHIFEPFFTTKERAQGTGLGLATVYGIVKQSGGYIDVSSEPMHGTTFRIYIPSLEEDIQLDKEQPATEGIPAGSETVLVVEDEKSVRALTCQFLIQLGYKVLVAGSGMAALEVASQHHDSIDLLVTDVVMPTMGGGQVAEALRRLHPHIRVLFLSGYTEDDVVRHGVLDSANAFLPKPFTMAALAKKVRELLDAES